MDAARTHHASSFGERKSSFYEQEEVPTTYSPHQPTLPHFQDMKRGKPMGIFLKVIIGKTVEAFKVCGGLFQSEGKAGVAILGNESQSRYDLYVYKEDQQKITSARITPRFKFKVHPHLYATFYDNSVSPWSVRFDQESDMTEFINEVALARWRSPGGSSEPLEQDLLMADSRRFVTEDDTVQVSYTISFLTSDNKFNKGVSVREFESSACCTVWETPLIGVPLHSKKIVALPCNKLGQWADITPPGHHVWLEMHIKHAFPHSQKLQTVSSASLRRDNYLSDGGSSGSTKEEITSRLVRMGGQALVPFPGYPSEQTQEEEVAEPPQFLERKGSLGSDQEEFGSRSTVSQLLPVLGSGAGSPVSHQHDQPIRISPYTQVASANNLSVEEFPRVNSRGVLDSEFNMLFSEMRTCNSEVRMSLMRVTDKLDALASRNVESRPSADTTMKSIIEWIQNNSDMKPCLEDRFNLIVDQNQALMEMLLQQQKSKTETLKKIESLHEDMISYLITSHSGRSNVLKESISDGDGLLSKVGETRSHNTICCECKCHSKNHIAGLEECLKTLEERNSYLESAKIEVDYQLVKAEEKLSLLGKQSEEIVLLQAANAELESRMRRLEVELEARRRGSSAEGAVGGKVPADQLTEVVKSLVNQAYRAIKAQLGQQLEPALLQALAHILRGVTSNYLEKYSAVSSCEEESERGKEAGRSREASTEGSEAGRPCPSSSFSGRFSPTNPLPPVRPSPPPRHSLGLSTALPSTSVAPYTATPSTSTSQPLLQFNSDSPDNYFRQEPKSPHALVENMRNKPAVPPNESKCLDKEKIVSLGENSYSGSLKEHPVTNSCESQLLFSQQANHKPESEELHNSLGKLDSNSYIPITGYMLESECNISSDRTESSQDLARDYCGFDCVSFEPGESGSPAERRDADSPLDKTYTVSEDESWSEFVGETPREAGRSVPLEGADEPSSSSKSRSQVSLPPYVPLVNTEPPPLPQTSSLCNTPSPPSSIPGGGYSAATSKSGTSQSSKDSDEDWRPQPPPLLRSSSHDEDAWLFSP